MNFFFNMQKVASQPSPNAKPEIKGLTSTLFMIFLNFYSSASQSLWAFIFFYYFNYESKYQFYKSLQSKQMFRLLLKTYSFQYFKPKIANLSSLINKRQSKAAQSSKNTINLNIKNRAEQTRQHKVNKDANDILQPKQIKSMISQQKKNLSKQQLTINHLIKVQTKFSALQFYYKNNYKNFSHQNIVNLVIKALELRVINKKEETQSQKFNSMVQHASRNIRNAPPEELVKFLYMLKRIKLKVHEYLWIDPFIKAILKQFESFGFEYRNGKKQKYAQLFDLISIDTSIKLVHSLNIIHQLTGNHYDPLLIQLIKRCLTYFHQIALNPKSHSIFYSKKIIQWTFYCNFFFMSNKYKMPLNILLSFIKSINTNSQLNEKEHDIIFQIEETVHQSQIIRGSCRGNQIQKYKEFYHIYSVVYNLIQNQRELVLINPIRLLKYLKHIYQFTQQELKALHLLKMANSTNFKVATFVVKVYQKYFSQKYNNDMQKANIQQWIKLSNTAQSQFLGQYITFLSLSNSLQKQFAKLFNISLQHYSQLTLYSKLFILELSIKKGYTNIKILIDTLDNKLLKQHTKSSSLTFKKVIEVQQYINMFQLWQNINKISVLALDQHQQHVFFKIFFISFFKFQNIEDVAGLFSCRIVVDHDFFSFFVKKYIKFSERNRTLTKAMYNWVKEPQFKQQLSKQPLRVNENQDNIIGKFIKQKLQLRVKIKKCLSLFRFLIVLLEKIRIKSGNVEVNITQSTLFKELLFHFNEELKQLYFKELFTVEIYELANQITQYLQNKQVKVQQGQEILVFQMSKIFKKDIQKNSSYKFTRICQKYHIEINK